MALAPIAVQLYSLREEIKSDLEGVLKTLAETGYVGVEPFGGIDYKAAAPIIKDLGLEVPSMHANLPIDGDEAVVFEMAATYGVKQIILPAYNRDEFKSVDGLKRVCDLINQAAAAAAEKGFEYGYHNHWWEFAEVDGRLAYDIMLEHLDPSVKLQVDTYWVQAGGQDAAEWVKQLGDRAPLLHIKDGSTKPEDDMVAVGDGAMDIPAVVKAGEGHTEWLIVELDRCATDMMTAVQGSYEYLVEKAGLARGR